MHLVTNQGCFYDTGTNVSEVYLEIDKYEIKTKITKRQLSAYFLLCNMSEV